MNKVIAKGIADMARDGIAALESNNKGLAKSILHEILKAARSLR